jgi:hypothetical protein
MVKGECFGEGGLFRTGDGELVLLLINFDDVLTGFL